ncbi:hypothetical protein FZZ91_04520 [Synechococcus sp. HB1133]|nr:hypothetical protein [Synechococcus sp. PH41509]MCB4422105.1 hypothetical protein [Synechococcus sp. HB1133]MCB4429948.1 hypothetical protein [Synechococcus sp. HBA1120]NHI81048.1 hypothetical protein [Synechococcus sp. HB1133]
MLRHNAIEVLDKMCKLGWRSCPAPVEYRCDGEEEAVFGTSPNGCG